MPAGNLYPANGLSVRDAAMVEFLAIGAHAVQRTELKPGDRVAGRRLAVRSGSASRTSPRSRAAK